MQQLPYPFNFWCFFMKLSLFLMAGAHSNFRHAFDPWVPVLNMLAGKSLHSFLSSKALGIWWRIICPSPGGGSCSWPPQKIWIEVPLFGDGVRGGAGTGKCVDLKIGYPYMATLAGKWWNVCDALVQGYPVVRQPKPSQKFGSLLVIQLEEVDFMFVTKTLSPFFFTCFKWHTYSMSMAVIKAMAIPMVNG